MNTPDTRDEASPSKKHPSPTQFDAFLTWACNALQMAEPILVSKIIQNDYISVIGLTKAKSKKSKHMVSKVDLAPPGANEGSNSLPKAQLSELEPGIQILAFYDSFDNLVKIHFEKNRHIPRIIFKVIGLIIHFQNYLQTISIKGGLNKEGVYEIGKFLPFSRVTEICLDDTFIQEANYHILLETASLLRHLSLARCSINDAVVELIASTLCYPLPASRTLSILNLASNRITDFGAIYLSEMLRSNRQLSYLNLSGNMLTDTGAKGLFGALLKFPLSFAELLASRSRHMTYLKIKNEMIIRMVKELRAVELDRRMGRRKTLNSLKPPTPKKKGLEKEASMKSMPDTKITTNMDAICFEKATNVAENTLGDFKDPFDKTNTVVIDGVVYSHGNNSLAYLGLAYNNLSYVILKKLLRVLMYQKEVGRKPMGLINVSIEGNLLPLACRELAMIDDLLDTGLLAHSRRQSFPKKRVQSKGSAGR